MHQTHSPTAVSQEGGGSTEAVPTVAAHSLLVHLPPHPHQAPDPSPRGQQSLGPPALCLPRPAPPRHRQEGRTQSWEVQELNVKNSDEFFFFLNEVSVWEFMG